MKFIRILAGLFFLLGVASFILAQELGKEERLLEGNGKYGVDGYSVVFWNIENFFDLMPSPQHIETGFTPKGEMRWTRKRFNSKRDGLAKVLIATGFDNDLPLFIGLAEIENRYVLNQLVYETPLYNGNYRIVHKDSPDRRGIDVALFYRRDLFRALHTKWIPVQTNAKVQTNAPAKSLSVKENNSANAVNDGAVKGNYTVKEYNTVKEKYTVKENDTVKENYTAKENDTVKDNDAEKDDSQFEPEYSRDILYVKGVLQDLDTVHLFVNHWPSKFGGEKVSGPKRVAAALALAKVCDSLLKANENANILAMGDFNDTPDSKAFEPLSKLLLLEHNVNLNSKQQRLRDNSMVQKERDNVMVQKVKEKDLDILNLRGTIKYRGVWEKIDHFFISKNLLNQSEPISLDEQSVITFGKKYLLEKDKTYLGTKPRRTYIGPRYNGGLSDHLPIVLKIKRNW